MAQQFNKFNDFAEQLGLKKIDLNLDTLKVCLVNNAPQATWTQYSDLTGEPTTGNGYTAGGSDAVGVWSESPAGTGSLTGTDVVWNFTGDVGPFRYAVLYDDTSTTKHLIGWWDYGQSITCHNGESFTVDFGATILTLT